MSLGTHDATADRSDGSGPDGALGNPKRTRLWHRSVGVAAMVAVLVVGASATAHGATVSSGGAAAGGARGESGSASAPSDADPTDPPANLHGTFTVVNRDRSVQSRQWQWGEVVAMDDVSFTVSSADGFNGSYLIGPGVSVTGIGVGDTITVVGAGQAVGTRA